MKRYHIFLIIISLLSIKSYSQMKENKVGWAMFFSSGKNDFSESFQFQMANQLMQKFNAMVGIENYVTDKEFWVVVGMPEIEITQRNGYAFIYVNVHCPNNETRYLGVYWKAQDNLKIITQDSILPGQVDIGWCNDFDKEYFLSFLKEDIIENIKGTKLNFKFTYYPLLYPDLTIEYRFKTEPSESELNEIKNYLKTLFKSSYVSETDKYEGKYYTMLDFQGTEYNDGNDQVERFILALNKSKFSNKIESIKIK